MIGGRGDRDPHRLLARAVRHRAGGSAGAAIDAASTESWASATFRGARHTFSLRLAGDDAGERAAAFAHGLDAAEFGLPGHLVADIGVTARRETADGVTIEVEALTVEDA